MFGDLILIAVIMVCITDISGFWDYFEGWLGKRLKCKVALPKILICSTCQTHWCGLLYLVVTGQLSLFGYATVLLVAISTPLVYGIIMNARDIVGTFINLPMTFLK